MCECCLNLKEKKKSFQLFLKTKIEIKAVSSSKYSTEFHLEDDANGHPFQH